MSRGLMMYLAALFTSVSVTFRTLRSVGAVSALRTRSSVDVRNATL